MILGNKQLIGLKARTKSGKILGKLSGFLVDSDNGKVTKYIIVDKKFIFLGKSREMFIDSSQVVEINEKEIVVEDAIVTQGELTEEFV